MGGPAVRAPSTGVLEQDRNRSLSGQVRFASAVLSMAASLSAFFVLPLFLSLCVGAIGTVALPSEARAQFQRNLPTNGVVGVLAADPALPLPLVRIDSRVFRMAPGAIIVDQNNRSLLHAQIPQRAAAYIVFDGNGDILRMFLLTPDELQRLRVR
jgi:hypothetical protein